MQKSNQLWPTMLTAGVLLMTPVPFAYGQSQKATPAAADLDRTDPATSGAVANQRASKLNSSSQSNQANMSNTDPLNASPQTANPKAYQRDMEQRFPTTNDPGADNPARSRDTGS